MARTAAPTHATDHLDTENDGVLDFTHFRLNATEPAIVTLEGREFKDAVEYETFMAEPVVIEIHTSTDKNAPTHALVGVNGEQVWLPRGQRIRIPRRFVERLARSQSVAYKTERNRDMDADVAMDTHKTTAMDYGFSVLRDPNPKGDQWLRRVVRESR